MHMSSHMSSHTSVLSGAQDYYGNYLDDEGGGSVISVRNGNACFMDGSVASARGQLQSRSLVRRAPIAFSSSVTRKMGNIVTGTYVKGVTGNLPPQAKPPSRKPRNLAARRMDQKLRAKMRMKLNNLPPPNQPARRKNRHMAGSRTGR